MPSSGRQWSALGTGDLEPLSYAQTMTTDLASLPKLSNIGLADAGMAIVAEVVSNPNAPGMGWVFRSLPTADVGIDGQIEVVVRDDDGNRRPNGHIISVQVKTGPSYFADDRGEFWLVRVQKSTVAYWQSHSVPVILTIVNAEAKEVYWARGDTEHPDVFDTKVGIRVPKSQVLDACASDELRELAKNVPPEGRRLALLDGALPWMERLATGERLYLEVDEWINKSSRRKDVTIARYVDEDVTLEGVSYTRKGLEQVSRFSTSGLESWRDILRHQFPWATGIPDEDAEPDEDELYDAYLAEHGIWDSEDEVYIDYKGEFSEYREAAMDAWRNGFIGEDGSGEVFRYRVELKLNELGQAFLAVSRYLQSGPPPARSD